MFSEQNYQISKKKKSRAFYPMYLPFIWQFNFRLLRDLHQIKTKLHIFSLSILL